MRAIPYIPQSRSGSNPDPDFNGNIEKAMSYFPRLVHYNEKYLEAFNNSNYILIGREMARYYGLGIGEKINLLFPKGAYLSKDINIKQQVFTIAGFIVRASTNLIPI